jgi:hypothetical protein
VYYAVWEDPEGVDEDLATGEEVVTKAGWFVYLMNERGGFTCHHKEPFQTEAEARTAAAVTGLPEEPPEEVMLACLRKN